LGLTSPYQITRPWFHLAIHKGIPKFQALNLFLKIYKKNLGPSTPNTYCNNEKKPKAPRLGFSLFLKVKGKAERPTHLWQKKKKLGALSFGNVFATQGKGRNQTHPCPLLIFAS
jgi:hypothetical protein